MMILLQSCVVVAVSGLVYRSCHDVLPSLASNLSGRLRRVVWCGVVCVCVCVCVCVVLASTTDWRCG